MASRSTDSAPSPSRPPTSDHRPPPFPTYRFTSHIRTVTWLASRWFQVQLTAPYIAVKEDGAANASSLPGEFYQFIDADSLRDVGSGSFINTRPSEFVHSWVHTLSTPSALTFPVLRPSPPASTPSSAGRKPKPRSSASSTPKSSRFGPPSPPPDSRSRRPWVQAREFRTLDSGCWLIAGRRNDSRVIAVTGCKNLHSGAAEEQKFLHLVELSRGPSSLRVDQVE